MHANHHNFRLGGLQDDGFDDRRAGFDPVFKETPGGDFPYPVPAFLDQAGFALWQGFIANLMHFNARALQNAGDRSPARTVHRIDHHALLGIGNDVKVDQIAQMG